MIANLDDVADSFVEHVRCFEEQLKLFLTKRDYYTQKLKNFKSDLEILDQIRTLPCLHDENCDRLKEEATSTGDKLDVKEEDDKIDKSQTTSTPTNDETNEKDDTLMNLISQKDKKQTMDKVAVYCRTMLDQFTEQLLDRVKEEMNGTIKMIDDNKKIKKIESRLYNLDMLLIDVRQHVQDQNLLTVSFIQNQHSANTYNDPTIFTDLCSSHKTQLDLMFKYLNKTMAIRKKFQNSKRELTYSLLARLKTIMICETELNSLNWRVLLYAESLKKLKRSLEVVDQINLAPKVYFAAFKEVNRRNQFNFFFNLWAKYIVQMNTGLIMAENKRRNEFRQLISSHFLKSFFPKFDSNVPEFACNLPNDIDQTIPLINEQEFCRFIETNKQFDPDLDLEDNLLNGLVCRMNSGNVKNVGDQMKSDMNEILPSNNIIPNQISEGEVLSLANFVDSVFPVKEKRESNEIEQIKRKLNEEYESRLSELKQEYKLKLDEELKKLNQQSLSSSSISNNIACVDQSTSQLDNNNGQQSADNPQQELTSIFSTSNSRRTMFKNLVNELLTIKYTDYLKHESERNNGPFISFVSTIFALAMPKLR